MHKPVSFFHTDNEHPEQEIKKIISFIVGSNIDPGNKSNQESKRTLKIKTLG